MRSTLHAIIRSRVTPWVLLALSTTTGTLVALRLRPKAASPQLEELSERIRGRGREYVRGLALIVGGDPVMGDDLLASATDRMAVLADECVRLPGCDAEVFMAALGAAIDEQRLALREARRAPRPETSIPPAGNDAIDQPAGVAPASAAETPAPHRRLNLEEAITLNGPVKHALSDWLTWNRPQLADAYENYLFLRGEIAPIYDKAGLPEALLFAVMAQETGAKVH